MSVEKLSRVRKTTHLFLYVERKKLVVSIADLRGLYTPMQRVIRVFHQQEIVHDVTLITIIQVMLQTGRGD